MSDRFLVYPIGVQGVVVDTQTLQVAAVMPTFAGGAELAGHLNALAAKLPPPKRRGRPPKVRPE